MKKVPIKDRLNYLLEHRNLKQVDILELAKPFCIKYNIKLRKNDLSQYVNGKVEPGQDKLFILASALNVSEAWLLGYDVPMERIHNNSTSNNNNEPFNDNVFEKLRVNYKLLNSVGREKLIAYSEDLIGNSNYTKSLKTKKRA